MSQVSESTVSPISGNERRGKCGPWVARARGESVFLDAWMELVEEVGVRPVVRASLSLGLALDGHALPGEVARGGTSTRVAATVIRPCTDRWSCPSGGQP